MNKAISIGSRVITRKFEEGRFKLTDFRKKFLDKECTVTELSLDSDWIRVENENTEQVLWPYESVELVKEVFQPEVGEIIQCQNAGSLNWFTKRFIAKRKQGTYICENLDYNGSVGEYDFIRPIRRTLEDQVRDWVKRCDDKENLVEGLMELFATHQSELTDEEIIEYFRKDTGKWDQSAVKTVRHFTALKWKG